MTAQSLAAARTALITGASRGIGRHLARSLAEAGLDVAVLARNESLLQEVAGEVASRGRRGLTLTADVTDPDAIAEAVATAEQEFGSIDLLVNNAGVVDQEVPLWEAEPEQVRQVLDVNVYGAFLVSRFVVPGMLARGGGRVVNLNSGMGARDFDILFGYNAAKTALFRVSGGLHEAGFDRGLRAFEVAPGAVATDMTAGLEMHVGRTEWTPPENTSDIVIAIGTGELDSLSGTFLRANTDPVADLRARAAATAPGTETGRRMRLTDWAAPHKPR